MRFRLAKSACYFPLFFPTRGSCSLMLVSCVLAFSFFPSLVTEYFPRGNALQQQQQQSLCEQSFSSLRCERIFHAIFMVPFVLAFINTIASPTLDRFPYVKIAFLRARLAQLSRVTAVGGSVLAKLFYSRI